MAMNLPYPPSGWFNPKLVDTDGNGVSDYQEVYGQPPPPPPADTDGDGLTDDQEAQYGTNPNLAACRALPRCEEDAKSSAWPPAL